MQNDEKLRVGYISPGWPLSSYPSGIVAYVENIINGLDANVSPVILSFGMDEPETKGVSVDIAKYNNYTNFWKELLVKFLFKFKSSHAVSMDYKNYLRSSEHMYKQTLSNLERPLDILEMEESFGSIYHAINQSKTRYVTRLHGPWFLMEKLHNLEATEQSKLRIFYEGEAIKRSHGVTSPSLDVLQKVREYYNIDLPDAKVIHNPISLVSKKKQWVLVESEPYILFVGRFDSTKGGDLIIDSFNIIAQTDKKIMLYFVGPDRGIVVDGVEFSIDAYITENIQDESIRKRIKIHGHCGADQILAMRQRARVTVCCSRYENFSISLLEALAVGCPTVATAVGGNKEIVIDGYNGLLADPESINSIAEKVITILSDDKKSEVMSKHAVDDTSKRFSPKDIANQTVEYYQSVLDRY